MGELQKGVTLIELMVVGAIIAILFGFTIVNLRNTQSSASTISMVTQLSSDMRSQQLMAMTGQKQEQNGNASYGIHFDPSDYVLFEGSSYDPSDQNNLAIKLDQNLGFQNIQFPNATIVFQAGSGEVLNYSSDSASFQLVELNSGKVDTVKVNNLGVITTAD